MRKSDNRFNKSRSPGKKPPFKSRQKDSEERSFGSKSSSFKPGKDRFDKDKGGDKKPRFGNKFDKPFRKKEGDKFGDKEKRSFRDKDKDHKSFDRDKKPFRKKYGDADKGEK